MKPIQVKLKLTMNKGMAFALLLAREGVSLTQQDIYKVAAVYNRTHPTEKGQQDGQRTEATTQPAH